MKQKITFFLIMALFTISGYAQTQFWGDDFESSPTSGTRTAEVNGGTVTSYFRLTDGSTVSQVVPFTGKQGSNYWAGEDHNGPGTGFPSEAATPASNPLNELQIEWTGINISGKSGMSFRGLIAAASTNEPWDNQNACISGVGTTNTDYIIVEYSIDGGSYVNLIRFYNRGSASGVGDKYLFEDTDNNGCGDGTQLTNVFNEFTKTIAGTGTTMSIKIRVFSEGNNEEWGIDNFRLFETAACTPPTITANPPNRAICAGNNTTFPMSATGATAYQWQVNTGSGFTDITNGGVYSGATTTILTVTNATAGMSGYLYRCRAINGSPTCFTNTNSSTLTISSISLASNSQSNVSCNGGSNGAAAVSPTGGIAPYSYSWAPAGGTGSIATGLFAGTYTVTVTDNIGCTATRNFTITQPTALSLTPASQTNIACNGGATGAASVNNATGGAGGYTYNWTPGNPTGDGTTTVSGLSAGTWTCTVTDANGCTTSQSFTVTQPTALALTPASQTNIACNGGATGAASVNNATGGAGGYTYNWTPGNPTGDGTTSVSGLSAGTWTCTVTDANGCTTSQSFTVTQPTALALTPASQTNIACNGGSNGSASVNNATGGAGGYTYNWTPGNPTGDGTTTVSGLSAGTWTCTVTDANGCTTSQSFTVTQPTALALTPASQTNIACNGGATGAASVNNATGGAGGYTYNWTPGNPTGDGTTTVSGLSAGTWTCTVTDANGCTTSQSFTVTQPTALALTPASQTNIACNGGATGAASVNNATGGAGGYTYNWTPGNPTGDGTTTVSGLSAGTWTCTVTDANGCTTSQSFTVTQPTALVASISAQTNVSCNNGSNGTATVTVSGGTAAYTYAWSPSGGTAATATGLTAGAYTCTITDANGCTTTASVTITQPSALAVTTAQTNVSCNGGSNGSATVTVSGGTAAYTYAWSPTGGTAATATGLTAGAYTCTITDANGCTTTASVTITQPSALAVTTAQTNVSCNNGSNGSATVTVSGGTAAYTYAWSPSGGTAATATGLTAGTYTCTITDANGCTDTASVTITQPSALAVTTAQTNVSCNNGSNGSATVTVSGGTAAYTYAWSPSGGTAATATGLTAGAYTCTITDANGCTTTASVTITQPSALAVTTAQTNVSCNGGSNGTANVTVSGGTAAYTYAWSPSGGTAATATGLTAGAYTCTITDANGCTTTASVTITQPSALAVTTAQTNVSCNNGSNGSATVTVSGGTAAYTYAWSPSGGTAATATGLTAGTYTCTITDANGCTDTASVTITQPSALAVTTAQTNVSCNNGSNGSATVTVSGGTAAYTYAWSPTGGTAATATGLTSGTYTCTITDANGCTDTASVTITQPSALAVTTAQTNVSCNNGSNGTATVTVSGGTAAYTYAWSPSGGTAATATGLTAGAYTCTITDANGCTTTASVTITQPSALAVTTAQTNVSCNNGSNGSATVTVSGGTAAYTYAWSPSGGTAATATGLTAGTYTCTITDANGCTDTASVTITQPSALAVTTAQTNVSCNNGSNGSATVTVSGGTAAYTYAWSPSGGTAATATGLTAGTYTCTITDANGCTTTASVTITQPSALAVTTAQTNVSCNGGSNGTATVTVSGGTAAYTYAWSPSGGTAATATGLTAGTYTCTITDANGCTTTASVTITQPTAINNDVTQNAGILTADETGATYQWYQCPNTLIAGANGQSYTPTVVGDYKVDITVGGCTVTSDCITVTVLGNDTFEDAIKFSIYPNPSNGYINIKSDFDGQFIIVNQLGQTVKSFNVISNTENRIMVDSFADGIYFVKGINGTKISTEKLIIKN
jgi:hypothetical protein